MLKYIGDAKGGDSLGKIDSMAKDYFKDPVRFAATFNYLMYGGDPVIDPDGLTPLDSTEVKVVANDLPVQKYRDLLNQWGVMEDGQMVYVLLGAELQAYVHYAMPVKDCLYDAINYATQVSMIGQKYKGKRESRRFSLMTKELRLSSHRMNSFPDSERVTKSKALSRQRCI